VKASREFEPRRRLRGLSAVRGVSFTRVGTTLRDTSACPVASQPLLVADDPHLPCSRLHDTQARFEGAEIDDEH
jgi:hypothetical protein